MITIQCYYPINNINQLSPQLYFLPSSAFLLPVLLVSRFVSPDTPHRTSGPEEAQSVLCMPNGTEEIRELVTSYFRYREKRHTHSLSHCVSSHAIISP
jgi:hypothetical protein